MAIGALPADDGSVDGFEEPVSSSGTIRSAGRVLAALDVLVRAAPATVRVTDVSQRLQVDPATAYRLLATLVAHGYASRMPNRTYTVGPRSLPMAVDWVTRLRAAAAGPLHRVAAATGETVVVNQLLGDACASVTWSRPPGDPDVPSLRDAYPLWATAGGRALLSVLPTAQRIALLPPEPYPSLTDRTTTAWSDLRGSLREGIRDGMFMEQGEADSRLWCCAIALPRGQHGEVLSLAVVARGEPGGTQRSRVHRVLREESRNLGYALSYPK